MNTKVTIDDYTSIKSIVDCIASRYSHTVKEKLIERFYELFRILNNEQRNLMKLLSKNFCDISAGAYIDIIYEIIEREVNEDIINTSASIYTIPVADEADKLKTKSGNFIAYLMPRVLNIIFNCDVRKIFALSNVSYLSKHTNRNNSLIFFCDNFIGTGNQVEKCMKIYTNYINSTDTIIILSIAILEKGFNMLKDKYHIIYGTKYKRAISDNQNMIDLDAIRIMKEIENIIKVPKKYRFGYNKSEALLSFDLKAPNNTFPVYWYKGRSSRAPILPR